MERQQLKKVVYGIVIVIPFVLGTVGICREGESLINSMFQAFGMYFMAYGDIPANILIEIARWMAPIVLIGGVITAINVFYTAFRNAFVLWFRDGVAIYCSEEKKQKYLECFSNSIYAGTTIQTNAKHHIVLLDSDAENIALAEQIPGDEVYAELKDVDSFLMKSGTARYFNSGELIARLYWKKQHLFGKDTGNFKIGIVGNSNLARSILKYGLMNNIYALDQHLEYHIYKDERRNLEDIALYNEDQVIYHNEIDESIYDNDRVIIGETENIPLIEDLLYHSRSIEIHCYDRKNSMSKVYHGGQVAGFGDDLYCRETIMTDVMYRNAMMLNYHYECLYGSGANGTPKELYNRLSGFLKGSNIAACDYHDIRKMMLVRDGNPEIKADDKYVQMEHIRWCRFYAVNHWVYGLPKDKQERDQLHIHSCLVPYEDLSREDKDKDLDLEIIRALMEG